MNFAPDFVPFEVLMGVAGALQYEQGRQRQDLEAKSAITLRCTPKQSLRRRSEPRIKFHKPSRSGNRHNRPPAASPCSASPGASSEDQ
ncbi:unnamed protein product, partial [Nesidiocoris tenuis]